MADLIVAFQGRKEGVWALLSLGWISLEGLRSRAEAETEEEGGMAVGLELRESLWLGEVGERRPGEGSSRLWAECLGRAGLEVCGGRDA